MAEEWQTKLLDREKQLPTRNTATSKQQKPTGFNRDSSGLVIYSHMFRSGRANNNEHAVVKQLQSQHSLEADITGLWVPGEPELFQNKQNLPLDKMV